MAYTKQTWQNGDIITDDKLNHMEDGIANAGGGEQGEPLSTFYITFSPSESVAGGATKQYALSDVSPSYYKYEDGQWKNSSSSAISDLAIKTYTCFADNPQVLSFMASDGIVAVWNTSSEAMTVGRVDITVIGK